MLWVFSVPERLQRVSIQSIQSIQESAPQWLLGLLFGLLWGQTAAAHSLSAPSLPIAFGEYKGSASVDSSVLANDPTELWASAFWPASPPSSGAGQGQLGIVVLLHGNHGTCGQGQNPRSDSGCEYTSSGQCPLGTSVVRNHDGYNFLAQRLAAAGFLVLSVNANRGITCGSGLDEDWGLILARARLVLRHLELWSQVNRGAATFPPPPTDNTRGGVSNPIDAKQFRGRLDFTRIGLFGHSRGGEGVRAVWPLYQEPQSPWPAVIPGLRVRGVFEVGAVDGQSGREIDPDGVSWTQILPMCDGDVSDLQGRLPFERARLKTSEAFATPKSLLMVWGTNHNFFNSEWQENDSQGCSGHTPIFGPGPESPEQQSLLIEAALPFFTSQVGLAPQSGLWMNPRLPLPAEVARLTRVERDYISTIDQVLERPAFSFSHQPGDLVRSGQLVLNQVEVEAMPDLPTYFVFKPLGSGSGRAVELKTSVVPSPGVSSVDLRIQASRDLESGLTPPPLDLFVELVERSGRTSSAVAIRDWADVLGRVHSSPTFVSVRLPLAEFRGVQLSKVHAIRVRFGSSENSAFSIADIRWSSEPEPSRVQMAHSVFDQQRTGPMWSMEQVAPRPIERARVTGAQRVESNRQLRGRPSRDLLIEPAATQARIPVTNELPVLYLAGQPFRVSRYSGRGLVFSIDETAWQRLPARMPARVQIGRDSRRAMIWNLPDLSRAELSR